MATCDNCGKRYRKADTVIVGSVKDNNYSAICKKCAGNKSKIRKVIKKHTVKKKHEKKD